MKTGTCVFGSQQLCSLNFRNQLISKVSWIQRAWKLTVLGNIKSKNLKATAKIPIVPHFFCRFMKWLYVARNVAWVRKTFSCNEMIKNVASNVNVNKAHCVSNYQYPLKSTCQLCWSCKNVIHLASAKNQP